MPSHALTDLRPSAARCALLAPQAFSEVLVNNETWTAPMDETCELLGIEQDSINTLEAYLEVRGAALRGDWQTGSHTRAAAQGLRRWPSAERPRAGPGLSHHNNTANPLPCLTHNLPTPGCLLCRPPPQEYFQRITKRLKEVGATADRTNFYV